MLGVDPDIVHLSWHLCLPYSIESSLAWDTWSTSSRLTTRIPLEWKAWPFEHNHRQKHLRQASTFYSIFSLFSFSSSIFQILTFCYSLQITAIDNSFVCASLLSLYCTFLFLSVYLSFFLLLLKCFSSVFCLQMTCQVAIVTRLMEYIPHTSLINLVIIVCNGKRMMASKKMRTRSTVQQLHQLIISAKT